jgi:hypothetical protein
VADPAAATDDIEVESTTAPPLEQVAPVEAPAVVVDEPIEPEPLDAAEDTEQPEPQKKDRRSLQAKIDAQTAKQRQAERERDEYRTRLEALERAQPKREEPAKAEPQYTRAKPTEAEIGSKYADYPAYIEDLTDWKLEQRDAQQAAQQEQRAIHERRRAIETQHESQTKQFRSRVDTTIKDNPQWWATIDPEVKRLAPSAEYDPRNLQEAHAALRSSDPRDREEATAFLGRTAIADVLLSSEYALEVMATLTAKDIQRLSTLPPNQLFREMGRLEGSVTRPAAAPSGPAPVKAISHAPAPIKPVGTAASTGERNPLEEDLDIDEHIRVMNARDKKGRFSR